MFAQPREQNLPPFTMPTQEDRVRKAVTGNMLVRHAVPAAMDDRDPRLCADGLEGDLDLRLLARPKGRLTPTEDKPFARLPHPDAADLEDGAVRQCLGEASASWGSKASAPGERGLNRNSAFGVNHSAMSRVKISKARAGEALTRTDTRTCDVTIRARHDP